jgi:hypothetical protein
MSNNTHITKQPYKVKLISISNDNLVTYLNFLGNTCYIMLSHFNKLYTKIENDSYQAIEKYKAKLISENQNIVVFQNHYKADIQLNKAIFLDLYQEI